MPSNSPYKPRNAETSICPLKAIKGEIGGNNGARAREKTQSIGCAFYYVCIPPNSVGSYRSGERVCVENEYISKFARSLFNTYQFTVIYSLLNSVMVGVHWSLFSLKMPIAAFCKIFLLSW